MKGKGDFVLELVDVKKTYRSKTYTIDALKSVSLRISSGDLCCVMGPSGSGKTTLLKVSAGLLKPDGGSVKLFSTDLYEVSFEARQRIRRMYTAFMFQEDLLIDTLTLRENVELPLIFRAVPKRDRRELALKSLSEVGLEDMADRRPMEVSGGERRKISLARCLANNPKIMFLDEPTSNLDSKNALMIVNLIKRINRRGITVVLSTHDSFVANQLGKVIYMRDGKIVRTKLKRTIRRG